MGERTLMCTVSERERSCYPLVLRKRSGFNIALSFAVVVLWTAAASSAVGQNADAAKKSAPSAGGKQLFGSNCAACHGIDGKGSERAPNIADSATVRGMTRVQVFQIIQNGMPGTGMPSFHTLSSAQIDALVTHLRTLGGPQKSEQLPGDPVTGKTLFTGKAGCAQCHMVAGEGGFIATDLSEYGRIHSPEEIRTAIVSPGTIRGGSLRLANITLHNGEKYTGRVRNEDNYSIQLQTLDGTFHFVSRADVENLAYDSKPLMPPDYGSMLSTKEINDLVSYLMNAAGGSQKKRAAKNEDEDCSPDCD
jgi:cytochrome c oxidase cbb3-type subunit III